MEVKELKNQILLLPDLYAKAVENQTQAFLEVQRLEHEVAKLENHLSREENNEINISDDTDIELINLELELERLKLNLAKAENSVELEVRVSNAKVTESHVKAFVGTDSEVSRLRNEIVESKARIKIRKADIQRKRNEIWEKRRVKRQKVDSEDIDILKDLLLLAKKQLTIFNDEVDVLKIKLETLTLLAGLVEFE